ATDQGGHLIVDSSSIWVSNYKYPYTLSGTDAQREPLSIKLDKQIYKPGETAKVMITGPITGTENVEALVSVEGPKLYSYKLVALKSTAQYMEIPIDPVYAPNAYLSVSLVNKKHQFYSQEKMIKVSPERHFLNIDIQSDKHRYKPGESVKYTI